MRLGAYDVLRKEKLPYDLRSVVESALRAVEGRRTTLASATEVPAESIQETIIGRSAARCRRSSSSSAASPAPMPRS